MLHRSIGLAAFIALAVTAAACAPDQAPLTVQRSTIATTTTVTSAAEAEVTTTTAPPTTTTPAVAGPSLPAASPAELARRLVEAERLVRDPATATDVLIGAAFEQQLLYRQLGRTPDWDAAVLAAAPADLHLAITNNAAARREFRSMHSKLSDTLPAWRIVEPPPAEQLIAFYQEAEATFGVPWEVLAAVNLVETGLGRIRGTSVAGAQGPMQFMPRTWEAFGAGGDVNDPHDAIMGAARYLAHNGGGRGDIDNALWNYNHSDKYVRGVKHYAEIITAEPAAFNGFYHWQVVYLSTSGDVWLPTGFEAYERVPVGDHLARNPSHHLGTDTT